MTNNTKSDTLDRLEAKASGSSSAMVEKYTGWGTSLARRVGENEVKRTAGGLGRETAVQPPAAELSRLSLLIIEEQDSLGVPGVPS